MKRPVTIIEDCAVQTGPCETHAVCHRNVTPGTLDVGKLTGYLWDKHRIIATAIAHPEFNCIRVTPSVYTVATEVDRFAEVVEETMKKGIPA